MAQNNIIDSFYTIQQNSTSYFVEKRSKFYGYAYNVETEEEVDKILSDIKIEHYKATHHCYAYRLGYNETERYRINDDGEPSSTAGRPIYGQILSKDLTNILIIVVRYYGGTKLGVPGLINAYKTSAAMAIENNKILKKIIYDSIFFSYNYANINLGMRFIKDENLEIISQSYDNNNVTTEVKCRLSKIEEIKFKIDNTYGLNLIS
ncbi:MAG: IMPACT family protein [Bacteroidales bacterium]